MILTCLFSIIALLGFILIRSNINDDNIVAIGAIIGVFSSIFLIIALTFIIIAHVTSNHTIQQNKIEYEGLCKRYEIAKSEYEDVSKSDVIGDITAWNMKVYSTKYWSENPLTNWFNPKKIADNLYYIPLDLDEESEEKDIKR